MKVSQKIGIISDTHDNLPNVRKATEIFNSHRVSLVIHCGDFVAPFTLSALKDLQCPLIGVFGNCDGEREYLLTQADKFNFSIYQPPYVVTINDKRIFITHKLMTPNENFDILIYGHTHKPEIKYQQKDTKLIINSGEACGWVFNNATIAILNLQTYKAEIVTL